MTPRLDDLAASICDQKRIHDDSFDLHGMIRRALEDLIGECIRVEPLEFDCELCGAEQAYGCIEGDDQIAACHADRWIAAIRALAEGEGGE